MARGGGREVSEKGELAGQLPTVKETLVRSRELGSGVRWNVEVEVEQLQTLAP